MFSFFCDLKPFKIHVKLPLNTYPSLGRRKFKVVKPFEVQAQFEAL